MYVVACYDLPQISSPGILSIIEQGGSHCGHGMENRIADLQLQMLFDPHYPGHAGFTVPAEAASCHLAAMEQHHDAKLYKGKITLQSSREAAF